MVVAIIPVLLLLLHSRITYKEVIIIVAFWSVSLLNTFANKDQNWFWWLSSFYLVLYICANHWIIKPQKNVDRDLDSYVKSES
jgi:hypothetical protein